MKQVELVKRWSQFSAFWPSTFSVASTVDSSGLLNMAPYQFTFPFGLDTKRSVLLIARDKNFTAKNIEETGKVTLNYFEFNESYLPGVTAMGYVRLDRETKRKKNPFTAVYNGEYPARCKEAFQVLNCTLDKRLDYEDGRAAHYVLDIDELWLSDEWADRTNGADDVPNMPVTFSHRGANSFWFAELGRKIAVPVHLPEYDKE